MQKDLAHLTSLAASAGTGLDESFRESEFFGRIEELRESDAAAAGQIAREVLLELIQRQRPRVASLQYPDSVRQLISKEFDRIESELDRITEIDLGEQARRCDFRIVAFGRIPVGVEHMELGGVPRRVGLSGGPRQLIRLLGLQLRCRGLKPFFRLHMKHGVPPLAFHFVFNEQTQRDMFGRIAECLEIHRRIKGVVMGSWWYDPQIAEVSPQLSFLREFPLANGAISFRYGQNQKITRYALANSQERQAMFQNGEYQPVSYLIVWPRDALLNWAQGSK